MSRRALAFLFAATCLLPAGGCLRVLDSSREIHSRLRHAEKPRNWARQVEAIEEGQRLCPACKGHGTCWHCEGRRFVVGTPVFCPYCHGMGLCSACGGTGMVP